MDKFKYIDSPEYPPLSDLTALPRHNTAAMAAIAASRDKAFAEYEERVRIARVIATCIKPEYLVEGLEEQLFPKYPKV